MCARHATWPNVGAPSSSNSPMALFILPNTWWKASAPPSNRQYHPTPALAPPDVECRFSMGVISRAAENHRLPASVAVGEDEVGSIPKAKRHRRSTRKLTGAGRLPASGHRPVEASTDYNLKMSSTEPML